MNKKNNTDFLGEAPIQKLLFKLAIPAIAGQIINLLYNLVDRMYIGHIPEIGALALTGVGITFPLIMLISAFAALVSMGSAPRASIFLGKGDVDKAEKTLGNSVIMLIIISIILTLVFQIYSKPMLMLFGASENTIGYALDYINIYTLGTIFVQLTLGLNAFISAQGMAKTAMNTVLLGAIANIILDPIFIFTFKMGVKGAAIATIISQAISMIWIVSVLLGKNASLRIRVKNLKLTPSLILPALALGLSPFIMQSTESLLSIVFNSSLLRFGGDIAVGAMTILASVMQFFLLPIVGLSQGTQPIISYNFGAGSAPRVKATFKLLFLYSMLYAIIFWLIIMLFPKVFIVIFSNDTNLIQFTTKALRIYMATAFVIGAQLACQQTFIALGNAKASLFLALLRKILLLIPLIFIMPYLMADKTSAVFLAEPIADTIAVTTTCILFFTSFKKIK